MLQNGFKIIGNIFSIDKIEAYKMNIYEATIFVVDLHCKNDLECWNVYSNKSNLMTFSSKNQDDIANIALAIKHLIALSMSR